MRIINIAAVALCPMLLQAQVISPAPTQSAGQKAVLESRLAAPVAPGASADRVAVPVTPALRISSGLTFPKLVQSVNIAASSSWHWNAGEQEKQAVVKLLVDQDGKPSDIQVVRSLGPAMDRDLIAAVKQYRFQPGTLDQEPTPIEVNLTVIVRNSHL